MADQPSILKTISVGEALKKAKTMSPEQIIEEIKASGLRGRGGAGFPAGLKLEFTRSAEGTKYIVCNADEGEVGTFKDRKLLIEHFDKVLEGIAITAYVLDAKKALIYLRWEYGYLKDSIVEKIQKFMKTFSTIEIKLTSGAGAYVCGEETALLDSLEGKRGEARNKPPYPVNEGYLSSPTMVSNVETFACIPHIILEGADYFASVGTEKSKGPKLFAVSGDVENPGIYEFPLGAPLKDVLKAAGAVDSKAALVGGASGVLVKSDEFDRKLAFEDLPPGGSIVVFNSRRNMLDVLENIMEFFFEESCSQCVPCREGNFRLLSFIHRMKEEGTVTAEEIQKYYDLAETMRVAAKCGLGQSAPNPFFSIMENFRDDFVTIK